MAFIIFRLILYFQITVSIFYFYALLFQQVLKLIFYSVIGSF